MYLLKKVYKSSNPGEVDGRFLYPSLDITVFLIYLFVYPPFIKSVLRVSSRFTSGCIFSSLSGYSFKISVQTSASIVQAYVSSARELYSSLCSASWDKSAAKAP